jgi:hypothetical protein
VMHPLNEQCSAKAKATGRRCERRVVGGTVCWVHGGNAKQVKAKREQRVALWEVQEARAATDPVVVVHREPEELLLDALHDVNEVLSAIKSQMRNNLADPLLLETCGQWMDRLGRLGKVIVDGDLSQKLHERLGWLATDRASTVTAYLAAILQGSPLNAQQKLALWESRFDGLQLIADGQVPSRMLGDGTTQFTDRLKVEAAREEAVAEGIVWGDDIATESDSDGDGVPLVSSVDGNGFRG